VKKIRIGLSIAAAALASTAFGQQAPPAHEQHNTPVIAPTTAQVEREDESADGAIFEHLEFAIRYARFQLRDKDRPSDNSDNYLGSINKLDEVQNNDPELVVTYMFVPTWGVSLSYNRVEAKTITKEDGHTDGVYELAGPTLAAVYRYDNESPFAPFAEGGLAFFKGDFNHDPEWRRVGNDRLMKIDDTIGYFVTAGCDYEFLDDWSAELFVRYSRAEATDRYYLNGELREKKDIPMDNIALGLGVRYAL
jgi:outer membrane protein W